jgi:hypothetical protein
VFGAGTRGYMAMRKVTHKSFVPKSIEMLKLKAYESIAEEIRREAEDYINQIGAENVLSITENTWHDGFTVIVWHYTP